MTKQPEISYDVVLIDSATGCVIEFTREFPNIELAERYANIYIQENADEKVLSYYPAIRRISRRYI